MSCGLVLDRQGDLRLRRQADALCILLLVGIGDDGIPEVLDIAVSVIFGAVHQICVPILLHEPVRQAVAVIVGSCSVFVDDRELVAEHVLDILREIAGILAALLVADRLDLGIQRGIDLQASAVQKRVGLFRCLARVFLQIFEDLVLERVDKIGVDLVIFHLLLDIHFLNAGVDVVFECRRQLFLVDISLIEHVLQDNFSSLRVLFRIDDRVKLRRVLRNTGDDRAFRHGQLIAVFVKISLGRRLDSERAVTEVDRIEIIEKDGILAH